MANGAVVDRKTRSGAVYTSCLVVKCAINESFDLDALTRTAMNREDELALSNWSISDLEPIPGPPEHGPWPQQSSVEHLPTSHDPLGVSSGQLGGSERPRKLDYQHWLRKQAYEKRVLEQGHIPSEKTLKTLIPKALKAAKRLEFKFVDLPVNKGAYSFKNIKESVFEKPHTLKEAIELGVEVYEWNGRDPVPFVDKEGRIFMVLAGRPTGQDYLDACDRIYDVLATEQKNTIFTPNETDHRRGEYPIINVGVTHGMGTLRPTFVKTGAHTEVVEKVINDPDVQRIATFGSASFALWGPRTYRYYKQRLELMYSATKLRRIIPRSVFPAATLNFGPKVYTRKHNDPQNCPYGWCTVTPVGDYDPKNGGHLIVWDLGIAIEFPPGSTILLPSAALFHSNTTIGENERRASFTQYASGGLFRWVDYGFQLESDLKKNDPSRYEEIVNLRSEKWGLGVAMFSTIEELEALKS